ncbi:glycosyltransferase family 39 protein [bacterium]|nr:glycosyltransferase family 39 protein [bacterium]
MKIAKLSHFFRCLSTTYVEPVLILILLCLCLCIRVIAFQQISASPFGSTQLPDEQLYFQWASAIAESKFSTATPFKFAPLPAYVFAITIKLMNLGLDSIRYLNIILGSLACLLIALSAKKVQGPQAQFIALTFAALYSPFILYAIVPLKTSLELACFSLYLFLVLRVVERPQLMAVLCVGIASGLCAVSRENTFALIPLNLIIIFLSTSDLKLAGKLTRLFLYILGCSAVISPFAYFNYQRSGHFILSSTQGGMNFYLGTGQANIDPYFQPTQFAEPLPAIQEIQFQVEAAKRLGQRLTPLEASRYWYKQGVENILNDPLGYLKKITYRVLAIIFGYDACEHYDLHTLKTYISIFQYTHLSLEYLFLIFILGLAAFGIKDKKSKVILSVLIIYCLSILPFYSSARYRLPILVCLIPLTASYFVRFWQLLRELKSISYFNFLLIIVAFIAAKQIEIPGFNDTSAADNMHAFALSEASQEEQAQHLYEKIANANQRFSDYAKLALAAFAKERHQYLVARKYLNSIKDDSYAVAQKYFKLAELGLQAHDLSLEQVVKDLEKSLSINSAQVAARKLLGQLSVKYNPTQAQRQSEELFELLYYYQ